MRLYLFRHCDAAPEGVQDSGDSELPLDGKNRSRLIRAVAGLREMNVDPELILTSPVRSARESAEIVAQGLGSITVEVLATLGPDAEFESLRKSLEPYLGLRSVALVGHKPGLTQLASYFLAGAPTASRISLKKGSVAHLRGEFSELSTDCTLQWLLTLKVLRRL